MNSIWRPPSTLCRSGSLRIYTKLKIKPIRYQINIVIQTNLHFHHSFYPLEIQTYKMLNKTVSKNQFEIYKSFIVRNISTHISYFSMSIISLLSSIKKFRSFNLCQIIECLHLTFHWVWYFQELFFTSATFHLMQFNLPTFYTDWKKNLSMLS